MLSTGYRLVRKGLLHVMVRVVLRKRILCGKRSGWLNYLDSVDDEILVPVWRRSWSLHVRIIAMDIGPEFHQKEL